MPNENIPVEFSLEARQLLERHGYLWDNWAFGFRRTRDVGHETTEQYRASNPDIVSFEELKDHGCFKPEADLHERRAAYDWLEKRLKTGKPVN